MWKGNGAFLIPLGFALLLVAATLVGTSLRSCLSVHAI